MPLYKGDKAAGFIGMIITTLALFVIAFTIVQLTNAKFAGHGEANAEATTR